MCRVYVIPWWWSGAAGVDRSVTVFGLGGGFPGGISFLWWSLPSGSRHRREPTSSGSAVVSGLMKASGDRLRPPAPPSPPPPPPGCSATCVGSSRSAVAVASPRPRPPRLAAIYGGCRLCVLLAILGVNGRCLGHRARRGHHGNQGCRPGGSGGILAGPSRQTTVKRFYRTTLPHTSRSSPAKRRADRHRARRRHCAPLHPRPARGWCCRGAIWRR